MRARVRASSRAPAPARVSRAEARRIADSCAAPLREQFGAKAVYLLGLAAGGSPWHARSDLDLAVEGLAPERWGLRRKRGGDPGSLELRALGSTLHDFYTAAERAFERIAVRIDEDLPAGPRPHRHTDPLRRMERPWGEARPEVFAELKVQLEAFVRG